MQKYRKRLTDILALLMLVVALITGLMLHNEVHHLKNFHNSHYYGFLMGLHETAGLLISVLVGLHCVQHDFWFRNYGKIPVGRKRVTTILLLLFLLVLSSGVILMCGSHSHFVSIFHLIASVLLTLTAIGHVAKRWKLFKMLFR